MASNQRITAKQIAFADNVASGMTLSDAYRQVYNAENMKAATVHSTACVLATNPKVATRVQSKIAEFEQNKRITVLSNRVKVLNKLNTLMDDVKMPGAVQLNAAIWLGKTDALFTDVVDNPLTNRDLETIDKEITDRLAQLDKERATAKHEAKQAKAQANPPRLVSNG